MKTFTQSELDDLVVQGDALGYVGLGTVQLSVCSEHGQRIAYTANGMPYHYPHGPGSYDHSPCYGRTDRFRVFNCHVVPYQELHAASRH